MSKQEIERVYKLLSTQRFADFYAGLFKDHLADSQGPTKAEVCLRLAALLEQSNK